MLSTASENSNNGMFCFQIGFLPRQYSRDRLLSQNVNIVDIGQFFFSSIKIALEKMESSIDQAIDYLIIQLIKPERFMYDKKHPKYLKKNVLKEELYEVISQAIYQNFEYNLSGKFCIKIFNK